jgi:hypothetical protein
MVKNALLKTASTSRKQSKKLMLKISFFLTEFFRECGGGEPEKALS